MHLRATLAFLLVFTGSSAVFAQQTTERFEAGVQFTVIKLHWVNEIPVGFGGRFTWDLPRQGSFVLSPEAEVSYFPQNRFGFYGETEVLAGIKAGARTEKYGLFAKVRPGLIHFGGDTFWQIYGGAATNFAVDVGGVFEYYPSSRITLRMDMGDTMMYAPRTFFRTPTGLLGPSGNFHNYQAQFGVGFRF